MTWFERLSLMVTTIGLYNCARFVWTYRKRSHGGWSATSHGRYMMFTALVLGSLFALIVSNRLFPGWYGREIVTIGLYFTYVAFTGWLNKLLDLSFPDKNKQEDVNEQQDADTGA